MPKFYSKEFKVTGLEPKQKKKHISKCGRSYSSRQSKWIHQQQCRFCSSSSLSRPPLKPSECPPSENLIIERNFSVPSPLPTKLLYNASKFRFEMDLRKKQSWARLAAHYKQNHKQLFNVVMLSPVFHQWDASLKQLGLEEKEFMGLPVEEVQTQGYLLLWIPTGKLGFGIDFLKKHKYSLRGQITWEKIDFQGRLENSKSSKADSPDELCLVGQKGSLRMGYGSGGLFPSIIRAIPRIRNMKPEEIYEVVEGVVPPVSGHYLEVFANAVVQRRGWVFAGKDVNEFSSELALDIENWNRKREKETNREGPISVTEALKEFLKSDS